MPGTRRTSIRSYGTTAIASSPWIVVSVGVVVMVVLLAIALGTYRGRGPAFDAQPGPPPPTAALADPAPSATSSATRSPRAMPTPSGRATGRPTPQRPTPGRSSRPPSPTPSGSGDALLVEPPPPSAAPSVSGRYRVVASYATGFVGEVLVSNASSTGRGWTARLTFPGGRLDSAWVEGAAQGTARRIDDGFTYHSGPDLPGGASAALRFYVQGTQSRPASCTVDNGACRL
ncbi:cellulose binding domain-containing protein [Micromonospora peucetia]|uniref:cellulose binding domain-containing protein n=1 Tax=Micromonospora peucetia TaxID=47871 RepID=UPI0022541967|nr:cellulose binding domain-containing protein [Micromonospora peucetia]MCX4388328.1 cellulose binding domain-containing protein [Micromonospora peucetia]